MPFYSCLFCFLASGVTSLVLTRCVRDFAVSRGLVTAPILDRHVHRYAVPRLGGIALFLSVTLISAAMLVVLGDKSGLQSAFSASLPGLFVASTVILLLGVYDDLRGANAYLKFGVQSCAALLLYVSGFRVHHFDLLSSSHILRGAISLPLTVFWVLLITNAFNLIDGLDGLAAGSAFFSTVVIFTISLLHPNLIVSLISVSLAGAILGFLRFNFNPASIFLGDSGSLFIGFTLSALALAGSQKAATIVAVTTPVLALGLPILDVVLAITRRMLSSKPLFDGDHDHIHHKLLKRGLSHRAAVLVLYAATAGFGLLSMALLHGQNTQALVLMVVAVGVVFGVQQLRYIEFAELSALFRAIFKRRILANNVSIRRASELLKSCSDREAFCKILQVTLQPLGFSGFRLENLEYPRMPESSIRPLVYDPNGRMEFCWTTDSASEPDWELRLQLTTSSGQPLGYLCLFQVHEDRRQSFDLSVMTDGVRTSISDALQRTLPRSVSCQLPVNGKNIISWSRQEENSQEPLVHRADQVE